MKELPPTNELEKIAKEFLNWIVKKGYVPVLDQTPYLEAHFFNLDIPGQILSTSDLFTQYTNTNGK